MKIFLDFFKTEQNEVELSEVSLYCIQKLNEMLYANETKFTLILCFGYNFLPILFALKQDGIILTIFSKPFTSKEHHIPQCFHTSFSTYLCCG